ncbi:MAG TPA: DegT/DnrJ/EryC1/StrS family aminotransferase, partial [Thermoleophilia bacterium]|nr:DegT/DnrJ/EryC1/StrS family aminotransferase [Thermoleophilia bacterium]
DPTATGEGSATGDPTATGEGSATGDPTAKGQTRSDTRASGQDNVIPFPRHPGETPGGLNGLNGLKGFGAVDDAVGEALKSGWLTQGRELQELTERGVKLLQRRVVPVAGGAAAAHLALLALDLDPGDEVVLPALVPPSLANLVLLAGGRPVFADIVAPESPVLDPDDVARRSTPATRVIVAYHPAGHPAPAAALAGLADSLGIPLIEVCWDALGARLAGRPVGTFGVAGAFALHRAPDGGGLVACAGDQLRGRIEELRSTAVGTSEEVFEHDVEAFLGNGYRINEAAAAAGVRELETLAQRIAERRSIVERVRRGATGTTTLAFAPGYLPTAEPSYDALPVLAPSTAAAASLANRARLARLGAVLPQPAYRFAPHNARLPRVLLPKTEEYCARAVELPVVEELLSFPLP